MKLNTAMLGTVVLGGIIAIIATGHILYAGRKVDFINNARKGYDTGLL